MTNSEVLLAWVKRICNIGTIDPDVASLSLSEQNLKPDSPAENGDSRLFKAAVSVARSFVATSISENGMSISIDRHAIDDNIAYWCGQLGLDASEFINTDIIEDGSYLW